MMCTGAGPRGFEPLVFGFPSRMRPEADALIRTGQRTLYAQKTKCFRIQMHRIHSWINSSLIHQAFFFPDFSPA